MSSRVPPAGEAPELRPDAEVALAVRGLRVELDSRDPIVEDLSLELRRGEILGLVGESGSGKTTTATALLGFAPQGTRIASGEIRVGGEVIPLNHPGALRRMRGRVISYVPQDPANSLNPALRIAGSIADMFRAHSLEGDQAERIAATLARVHLPSERAFSRRYPHELSGGQQQRVMIGIALMCRPAVVVLDEPTTGLDVVTQAKILDEIEALRRQLRTTIVYISHDLGVVGKIADRIAVMYAGRIVEYGPASEVLTRPRHPYTRGLVEAIPDIDRPGPAETMPGVGTAVGHRPDGCAFAPRCPQAVGRCSQEMPALEPVQPTHTVRCFEWSRTPAVGGERGDRNRALTGVAGSLLRVDHLRATHGNRRSRVVAADDVSFGLAPGVCVALVGESGSGKTTVARCVAGLHSPAAGRILLNGEALAPKAKDRPRRALQRIQLISQNPYESLNPSHRIGDQIARPARRLRGLSAQQAEAEALRLLELVRLSPDLAQRYPAALSGGERQRVAIARALASGPDLLICDEITSALDVSVQGAVLALLEDLRRELGLALLLITHDLGVVAAIADHVLVLEHGVVREEGAVERVLREPRDDYTRRLLAAVPRIPRERGSHVTPDLRAQGEET